MKNDTYVFKNIPQQHPIAILSESGGISYSGDSNKRFVQGANLDITNNGVIHTGVKFYYGDVTITVSSDFKRTSLYCYYHGYMGGHNVLRYDSGETDQIENINDASTITYDVSGGHFAYNFTDENGVVITIIN